MANPSRALFTLLAVLVAGDLLFISLHWLHVHSGMLSSELWSIQRDRSFGEMFQYLKYLGIMLALAQLFRVTRLRVLLGWIGVFAFLLFDDSMRIHERFGLHASAWLDLPTFGGMRGRDIGELLFAALVAAVLLPVLGFGYVRGSAVARAVSTRLAVLLAALVMFGVGGDVIHRLLSGTDLDVLAGMVEDGGEMLVLSLTCYYVAQWLVPRDSRSEYAGAVPLQHLT